MTRSSEARERARVALIITELSRGGAEKALFNLAVGLDRERFEPTVVSLSGLARDQKNSLAPDLRARGIETIELGMTRALDFPRAALRLARILKRGEFDVAQSFMFHANIVGRIAGRLAGVPAICSGVRVAERDSRFRLRVDRATRAFADVWVCVGDAVADFTVEVGGIPRDRVVSIPNGVEVVAESEPASSPRGTRRRLIATGRLTRQKGYDELLAGMRTWLTPAIERDWELLIVGDGDSRAALEKQIATSGLEGFVSLLGWRSDARELMSGADAFLLPSRWEGMPNALLEASARGLPCLCRDVEGVREILGDSEEQISGAVDSEEWRLKLLALLGDDELRRRLGAANRSRVERMFSVAETTRRYERLWTTLLAKKGRALREAR